MEGQMGGYLLVSYEVWRDEVHESEAGPTIGYDVCTYFEVVSDDEGVLEHYADPDTRNFKVLAEGLTDADVRFLGKQIVGLLEVAENRMTAEQKTTCDE
jgi:hypothetical protein